MLDDIIKWESGEMTQDEEVAFAQKLWDTGLWRSLQGCYGRFVHSMLEVGLIS